MTNALVVPLLALLGLGVLAALLLGPARRFLGDHATELRGRARTLTGSDTVAKRQQRIIRSIAAGVPRKADHTAHSRVLPPAVRVDLHPDDLEAFLRIRDAVEAELNEDWRQQVEREGWFCPDVIEVDPVVSDGVPPGHTRLHLLYDAVDDPTPAFRRSTSDRSKRANRAAAPTPLRAAKLATDTGESVWLAKVGQSVLVGRGRDCDLVVDHEFASKKHLELVVRADGILVRDVGSTNGTFVGGRRIGETLVRADTEICLGKSKPLHLTWS